MIPDPPEDGYAPDDEGELLPSEQPTVDASDVKAIRKRARTLAQQKEETKAFYRGLFSTVIGRREMWAILTSCHTFETQFAVGPGGFPDPLATWFHAGEQALGQRLYQSWLLMDREGVFQMQDENDPRFAKPQRKKS